MALVVEHGSGAVLTRCVGFDTASLTGEQVLQLSGVEYQGAQYGGNLGKAVCQIDYEPQTYPSGCFNSTSPYWAMFVSRAGGPWAVSSLGVSSQVFRDGDAEGWRFDPQNGAAAQPPSPAGVCDPVAAAPSPSPSPPAAPVTASSPAPGTVSVATPPGPAQPAPAPSTPDPESPSPGPSASGSAPGQAGGPAQRPPGAPTTSAGPPWGLAAGLAAVALLVVLGLFQARRPRG